MNKLLPAVAASVLAACFALPLNAMPIVVPKAVAVHTSDVEQVKHRRHGNGHAYGHWKKRRYASRDCRYYDSCYRPRYYRERYGYRDYSPYRRRSGVTVYFNF
ncbi:MULTISPECIES: hypothetical protein [Rhizobium]|uniref:BA14K family protein n=2 Tax=Rhizobium TaxID=379 RepID=A0A2A5KP56_9HYPH|nr:MULTISPECIES: hypothetical protein [Rhizobium]AJC79047.1 hypothetical protein IE4803_CH01833 [Rhizobium etli bv. phaseoli str. IE4803]UWU36126.1 hypothetical protein N2597_07445 [Rhizobium leguminosarum bv. phaseoli]AIC27009.1 hypothetical protein IE4771_CH01885 [Rhizobium sp. IE4771]PCK78829.1 hypothetical protein CPT34_22495 [Rhizobium sophoriradicis]PCK86489.1 hypothetical protein CPT32_13650 [Rhizobium sophoriradicis]